jgi:16S rRNA (adenine1518-N6/adenine1519-N6)-dimethyltransferase
MIKSDAAKIADKRFGQNFLKDDVYLKKIIEAMPDDDLPIVEIGPGLGDLTKELVKARHVTAYEVDKRLCEHLKAQAELFKEERLTLRCTDVLEHWEHAPLSDEPYHLVANLPYYIATRIVLKALNEAQCRSILVMVQKEVAEKFAASPGEKAFSALSVLAQSAGKASLLFEVPPSAFAPPPKVTSAVLSIEKERSIRDEGFERFLKTAFAQPRKTLLKNLSARFDKARLTELFEALSLPLSLRPHEAATSTYHLLYKELEKDMLDGKQQPKSEQKRKRRQ